MRSPGSNLTTKMICVSSSFSHTKLTTNELGTSSCLLCLSLLLREYRSVRLVKEVPSRVSLSANELGVASSKAALAQASNLDPSLVDALCFDNDEKRR